MTTAHVPVLRYKNVVCWLISSIRLLNFPRDFFPTIVNSYIIQVFLSSQTNEFDIICHTHLEVLRFRFNMSLYLNESEVWYLYVSGQLVAGMHFIHRGHIYISQRTHLNVNLVVVLCTNCKKKKKGKKNYYLGICNILV